MDDLVPIGQFAALTSLSPKALRLYHDNGLLEPAHVDAASGYRYYAPAQVPVAARIALLRRAGIGLTEIAGFLADADPARIERWRTELDAEVAERRRLLDHLATTIDSEEITTMTTTSAATLDRAVPVLASLDIEATQRFYAERLGFDAVSHYPDYGIVRRDDIELHFFLTDDAEVPRHTGCYVRVTGVDALYAEMQAAGVVHPNGPLLDQPWGQREFAVLDGDGNLLRFGQAVGS